MVDFTHVDFAYVEFPRFKKSTSQRAGVQRLIHVGKLKNFSNALYS